MKKKKPKLKKRCPECGKNFISVNPRKVFCGCDCQVKNWHKRQVKPTKMAEILGAGFVPAGYEPEIISGLPWGHAQACPLG